MKHREELYRYKFDLLPSEFDKRDYVVETVYYGTAKLPEEYTTIPELPPVRDQGEQGSCSAMTAAVMKEYQERKDLGFTDHMSPQFVYNLRDNSHSEGMTPRNTMQILQKSGILPEVVYPYGSRKAIGDKLLREAANFKIYSYGRLHTLEAAKAAMFANGPIYFGFPVYNPNNPKFWIQEYNGQPMIGGHAVAGVGWTKEGIIIRNSWGTYWGNRGYTLYPFEEWGMHWEAWTTLDADSCQEKLEELLNNYKKPRCSLFKWFKK